MSSYSNFAPSEGSVLAETTVTLSFKPRRITITNDNATKKLNFKFNPTETFGTILSNESVTLDVASTSVILKSEDGITSIPYRIWGIG